MYGVVGVVVQIYDGYAVHCIYGVLQRLGQVASFAGAP